MGIVFVSPESFECMNVCLILWIDPVFNMKQQLRVSFKLF